MEDKLLTTQEALEYLGISKSMLARYQRAKKITPIVKKVTRKNNLTHRKNFYQKPELDNLKKQLDPNKKPKVSPTKDIVTEYGSTVHWSEKYRKLSPTKRSPGRTMEFVPITCKCGRCIEIMSYLFNIKDYPRLPLCRLCAIAITRLEGENHPDWTGGTKIDSDGYRQIHKFNLSDEELELFAPMFGNLSYIKEHRLVMARHLKRPLARWEYVHHVDGNRLNNDISNLVIHNARSHTKLHADQLSTNLRQKKEIELLKDKNRNLLLILCLLLK